MSTASRESGLDHLVVLMFENRSFDNLLGRLCEPGEVESFEGVLGKQLSNPIPQRTEHCADRDVGPAATTGELARGQPAPGAGVRRNPGAAGCALSPLAQALVMGCVALTQQLGQPVPAITDLAALTGTQGIDIIHEALGSVFPRLTLRSTTAPAEPPPAADGGGNPPEMSGRS